MIKDKVFQEEFLNLIKFSLLTDILVQQNQVNNFMLKSSR